MERTKIKDLANFIGQKVQIAGFVETIRDQGSIKFLILRDNSGQTQCVILKAQADVFELSKKLALESVVQIEGVVKAEKQAPGGLELTVDQLAVLSAALPELPIPVVDKAQAETEATKRYDWRWLDLRKPERLQIFKVWTALEKGVRAYLAAEDFIQIYTPSIMNAPSEGGSEVFELTYFDRKAYLAQSPQFYKQMAMAAGFERVFTFVPAFRAEPSFTTRHMTEFTSWDLELSYITDHYDVMAVEEGLLVSGFEQVVKDTGIQVKIPTIPFPKLTMQEAKARLKTAGVASEKEHDLSPEEERTISQLIKDETGHDFVFITDYHYSARAFYHMRHATNANLTKGFDLLYKGIEITTGAQREHHVDQLERQAVQKGVALDSISDYLNFFRYGCPPHGGLAIGPGRVVKQILDLASVKDTAFLPRDVKRLTP